MPKSNQKQRLPIGISDFRQVIEEGCYYIDKTFFIRDVIEASPQVMLFPRPRRFGKTLNLSTLRYFFEKSEENLASLFDGLMISKEELFRQHQGKHPVIYLTFKDLKALRWEDCYEGICRVISREIRRHMKSLKHADLPKADLAKLDTMMRLDASLPDYEESLILLSELLYEHTGEKVVILIDEYDTPIHAGYSNSYYPEIIGFMRNFLSAGLKDNTYLFKSVLTGILRVAKESVFSGLNNLDVYTVLDQRMGDAFGFTDAEVKELLSDYGMPQRYDEAARWYNGYLFGGQVIYNPWSVLNFVNRFDEEPKPYWVNTASPEIIDRLATREGKEIREEIGTLLDGGVITKPVYSSIVMRDLETRPDLLWSFLLFSGYLKPVKHRGNEVYDLMIPNHEIRFIFRELIYNWFAVKVDTSLTENMTAALESGDIRLFQRFLRKVVLQVMSYHDLGGEPEKVYHALVLGMLVWMSHKYDIRSNRESGYGRYDIMMKPNKKDKPGFIIEFKQVDEEEKETYETALKAAMEQIERRRYAEELTASGIQMIYKIAVVFKGKELWVQHEKVQNMPE